MREILTDTLNLQIEVEEIKKTLSNQNKNIELVLSYLDELLAKNDNNKQIKRIEYKHYDE